jgi:DNA-binding response OmpR family regulator
MPNNKILIVDDDPDVLQGMHLRLKANHYDICLAVDTFSGVAEARRSRPDLILLDLGLPAGGGFMVMERLKMIPSLAIIPVIVISARDGLGNQKRRLFFRNRSMMTGSWQSSDKLWENLQGGKKPTLHDQGAI